MTLYNNSRFLPEAIESILAQADGDFALLALDDGSTDETPDVMRRYAARDPRIHVERHAERQGMVAAWRRVFLQARQAFPSAAYFAWASDHDRWHPDWLGRMRAELDAHPEAVLAYSQTLRIDEQGALLDKGSKTFQTAGLQTPAERWLWFSGDAAGAGDLVYGLMRVEAVERAGIFRPVLLPDRLLMAEMTLQGEFRQVGEVLWFRRQIGVGSVTRQRRSLFTPQNAPAGLWLPPWAQHARVLRREYVTAPRPGISREQMRGLIARYVALYLLRRHSKSGTLLHGADRLGERVAYGGKVARASVWTAWYEGGMWLAAWWGRMRRRSRLAEYHVLGARRRVRAAAYESWMATRAAAGRWRRAGRRGIHHVLVLTHRLGLRGRS
ncbi:MAG: glycosyltransferase family 2 protein [Acidobacteria bacterium]|nr:glycosyltransferase family 2 protein [Acidobacteriota bacterium]